MSTQTIFAYTFIGDTSPRAHIAWAGKGDDYPTIEDGIRLLRANSHGACGRPAGSGIL